MKAELIKEMAKQIKQTFEEEDNRIHAAIMDKEPKKFRGLSHLIAEQPE